MELHGFSLLRRSIVGYEGLPAPTCLRADTHRQRLRQAGRAAVGSIGTSTTPAEAPAPHSSTAFQPWLPQPSPRLQWAAEALAKAAAWAGETVTTRRWAGTTWMLSN